MSWNERLAIINHFKPADDKICKAFGITQSELSTAREMQTAGTFTPSTNINFESYKDLFASDEEAPVTSQPSTTAKSGITSTTIGTEDDKPVTATKKVKEPKKRGRKGNKIDNAFLAIPATPTPVDQFSATHQVSVAVLRQSKRFDKHSEKGPVSVKKDKGTGTLMIWRNQD